MAETSEVVVIGAGPYGLSIAAHLAARNIPHRIFGKAMETWATQMPKGMMLKSDGYATGLYDPARSFTFERYCREQNIPFADLGTPPRREDFVNYGRAFQRNLVPHLEDVIVKSLERDGSAYRLRFETGASCFARAVIVAAGISHFAVLPPVAIGFAAGSCYAHLPAPRPWRVQRTEGCCHRRWRHPRRTLPAYCMKPAPRRTSLCAAR